MNEEYMKEYTLDATAAAKFEAGQYKKIAESLNEAANIWEAVLVKWESVHIANPSSQTLMYVSTAQNAVFEMKRGAKAFEAKIFAMEETIKFIAEFEAVAHSLVDNKPLSTDGNVIFANFSDRPKKEDN